MVAEPLIVEAFVPTAGLLLPVADVVAATTAVTAVPAPPAAVAGLLPAFVTKIGGLLSVRSACFCICLFRYVSWVYDLPQY